METNKYVLETKNMEALATCFDFAKQYLLRVMMVI
jgi:hypothetical protein